MKTINQTSDESDIIFSFYNKLTDTIPHPISFTEVMEGNRSGLYKDVVLKARKLKAENRKSEYDEHRLENIPGYMPALNLKEAGKENYTSNDFTGLLPLDIDDLSQDQSKNRELLLQIPWVVAVGKSTGGEGLFAIVRCTPDKYAESYYSAVEILLEQGINAAKSQGNPNRLRYVTYDPDLYYTPSPATAPTVPIRENIGINPLNENRGAKILIRNNEMDDPEIFKRMVEIKSAGEKIWKEGERHSYLIRIFTWANKIGMSRGFCLKAAETFCRPIMEKNEGYDIAKRVNDIYVRYAEDHGTKRWNQNEPPTDNFWNLKPDGTLEILHEKLIRFLETEGGFYNYVPDQKSKTSILIRIRGPWVEESSPRELKEFLSGYLKKLPREDCNVDPSRLMEAIYRGTDTYFGKGKIEFICATTPDFLKHTEKLAYYPFRNGIAEVSPEGVALKPYDHFDQKIWVHDVIPFNLSITEDDPSGEYYEFIRAISNEETGRIIYACTLIGYLLHTYKDPTKSYAVILGEETENEDEGGGTGKGIFIQGLSKLINHIKFDGKNFRTDKAFAFQRVKLNTKIIAIEDVNRDLDFERFYSIITEGVTIERKNRDEIFLSYANSPKILFTTNYTIPWTGNHGKRRHKLLEFSNAYHPGHTPEDQFGHRLFEDWNLEEWNSFYNFMFKCEQYYLAFGIVEVENSKSNRRKHIRLKCSPEFLEWWERKVEKDWKSWVLFSDLYNDFSDAYQYTSRDYSQKNFTKSLHEAAKAFGYRLERKAISKLKNRVAYRLIRKTI